MHFQDWAAVLDPTRIVVSLTAYVSSEPSMREHLKIMKVLHEHLSALPMKDLTEFLYPAMLANIERNTSSVNLLYAKIIAVIVHLCYYMAKKQEIIN